MKEETNSIRLSRIERLHEKLPQNKEMNFRMWKSGKTWFYAAATLTALAGGATAASNTKADMILPQTSVSPTSPIAAENTATPGLGSETVTGAGILQENSAGADNVSYANSAQSQNLTDSSMVSSILLPDAGLDTSTATNGSYAVNANGAVQSAIGKSAYPNITTDNLLNSANAIQAGSGAASSVSFDVAEAVTIPNGISILTGAAYTWEITPPSDLANAGLTVDGIRVSQFAPSAAPGALSMSTMNSYYAQTVGGTYETVNSYNGLPPMVEGSANSDSVAASIATLNGSSSLALVTINYQADSGLIGLIQAVISPAVATVTSIPMQIASDLMYIAAGITSFLPSYAAQLKQAADIMNVSSEQLAGLADNTSGMYSLNMLAPVTRNSSGNYIVSVANASFTNAITNSLHNIITEYDHNIGTALAAIVSVAPFITPIIQPLVNELAMLVHNFTSYVASFAGTLVSDLINIDPPTGFAKVTVGFTANDPTTFIQQNLRVPNHYYQGQPALMTADEQAGTFIPETFKLETLTLNGNKPLSNPSTSFTTVAYQL